MIKTLRDPRPTRVGIALLALASLVLILGLSSCGNDDDEKVRATPADTPGQTEYITRRRAVERNIQEDLSPVRAQTAKAAIAEVLEDVQLGLATGHGQGTCHELSNEAALAVARSIGGTMNTDCWAVIGRKAAERRRSGFRNPMSEVLSVEVDGDEATARVLYPDGSVRPIPFVREAGVAWKAASLDLLDDGIIESSQGDAPGGDAAAQITETIQGLESEFPLGLGSSVCSELTEKAQREVQRSGVGSGDCAARMEALARRALMRGYQPRFSEVGPVTVKGSRAAAIVKTPRAGRHRIVLTKTDDGWKVTTLRSIGVDFEKLR